MIFGMTLTDRKFFEAKAKNPTKLRVLEDFETPNLARRQFVIFVTRTSPS